MQFFSKQRLYQFYYMDAPHGHQLSIQRKSKMVTAEECYKLQWTNPVSNIPQNSSCMAAYLPFLRPFKYDNQDMLDTAAEARNELVNDVLQWTPSHEQASMGWSTRTYLQQLCTESRCSLEDLTEVMDYRDEWCERIREICTSCVMWLIMMREDAKITSVMCLL